MTTVIAVGLMTTLTGCDQKPTTDAEKLSYAYGVQMAQSVQKAGLKLDARMVQQAFTDVFTGKVLQISPEEVQRGLLALSRQADENRQTVGEARSAGEKAFVENFMKQEGVQRTTSGVFYRIITNGTSGGPKPETLVKMHYSGSLSDGRIFDSTYQRGQASTLKLEALVPGWQEVVRLMTVGAKWEVVIPPDLAYGSAGNELIPPFSALKLEIEVLGIPTKTSKE